MFDNLIQHLNLMDNLMDSDLNMFQTRLVIKN